MQPKAVFGIATNKWIAEYDCCEQELIDNFLWMKRWLLLSLFLLSLSTAVVLFGYKSDFKQFEPTLIVVNVTVAALAINFSFVAYQNSEYRRFQSGLSSSLLFGCLILLIWALTPALGLVFSRALVGVLGLAVLPITALFSLGLVALAKREGAPSPLIKQISNKGKWRRTLSKYAEKIDAARKEWERLALTRLPEKPMHEWEWGIQPAAPGKDPLSVLGTIGSVAARNYDIESLVLATQTLLNALDEAVLLPQLGQSPLLSEVVKLIEAPLTQIAVSSENADSTGNVSSHFLNVCSQYFGLKCGQGWPVAASCSPVANLMLDSAQRWIKRGRFSVARTPLVVIRQACVKGMEQWAEEPGRRGDDHVESLFWPPNLGGLAQGMKPLGTSAIQAGDAEGSEYLYRVLDAFGWLGCSSMKMRHGEVVKVCVRALAQLGREARARKLECHWDRCALEPHQHAEERIDWILSWLPEDQRESSLRILEQGYSRLYGSVVRIERSGPDENIQFLKKLSNTPHKESFISGSGARELDYSDISMLKDFELYGHVGGILVRGPNIPLTAAEDLEK